VYLVFHSCRVTQVSKSDSAQWLSSAALCLVKVAPLRSHLPMHRTYAMRTSRCSDLSPISWFGPFSRCQSRHDEAYPGQRIVCLVEYAVFFLYVQIVQESLRRVEFIDQFVVRKNLSRYIDASPCLLGRGHVSQDSRFILNTGYTRVSRPLHPHRAWNKCGR
jgi:hypothetical protein